MSEHTRRANNPLGRPFPPSSRIPETTADRQGESLLEPYPGLKPWAILLCHFVATAVAARRENEGAPRSDGSYATHGTYGSVTLVPCVP